MIRVWGICIEIVCGESKSMDYASLLQFHLQGTVGLIFLVPSHTKIMFSMIYKVVWLVFLCLSFLSFFSFFWLNRSIFSWLKIWKHLNREMSWFKKKYKVKNLASIPVPYLLSSHRSTNIPPKQLTGLLLSCIYFQILAIHFGNLSIVIRFLIFCTPA